MEEIKFKRCPKCDCLMLFNQEICHSCGTPSKAEKPKKKPYAKKKSSSKKA